MPALSNPKHERFAQLLAKGKIQAEAYVEAGYKPSEQHASRLASSGKVAARVAEILERAATRVEVSVASITENLLRIAGKAEALAESSGLSVARAAQMDVAKLNGLAPDKLNIDGRIDGTHTIRPAELSEALGWISRALGGDGKAPD